MKLSLLLLSLMLSLTSTVAVVRGVKIPANTSPSSVKENFAFGDEVIFQINMRRLAKKGAVKGHTATYAATYSTATHPKQHMDMTMSKSGTPASSPVAYSPASSPVGTEAPVISTCCDCSSISGGSKGSKGMYEISRSSILFRHFILTCISLSFSLNYKRSLRYG